MGTSLSGTKIKDTYDGLIKTSNNAAVGSSNVELTDGVGNDINISINNTGALTADGNITGASIIKTGGTSTQLLLANGAVVTLTLENSGIGSNDSDTKVPSNAAVKDYVDTQITNLIDSSPTALDTLNELAAALGDDANFSTTVNTALGNRLRIDVNSQGLTATQKTNGLTNLGVTADPAELNILDGATLSTAELNFVDGVTSAIQTQIDAKQDTLSAGSGISISGTTIATDLSNLVGTGAIQADAVTAIKMAQFDDNLTAATGGDILVSNGTDFDNVTMSGDVTIASTGATTIGSGAVETGMIAADAVTGAKIADDAVDSEHFAAGSIDEEHLNATNSPVDNYILSFDNTSGGFTWIESTVSGGGISWQSSIKTSDFTASAGEGYFVNTTSGAITVTMPSSPSAGNEVHLVDYAGTADTNNITITSSDDINASTNDVTINYERGAVSMVYVDATQGWVAYNAVNEGTSALGAVSVPLSTQYLVVAGGGGGGDGFGGGGGAGGYKTNFGGTALTLSTSTNYNIQVGTGGATGAPAGANGGNSIFSTITSTGGGGGADGNYNQAGKDGGSGGGGGYSVNAGGTASPSGQGNNGGSGSPDVSSNAASGGGGGGANAVGASTSTKNTGGAGGAGLSNSITGSAVVYAGGGGGGIGANSTGSPGSGGSGGGGTGSNGNGAATAGTSNTGGGGGGGGQGSNGGNGGSGIVILRYPDSYNITVGSGLTAGTLNASVGSNEKYSTFTAGTGTISFS